MPSDSSSAGSPTATPDSAEQQQPAEERAVTFSWGILMVRTKRLLHFLDDLARYRIFGDLGWVYLAITLVAGAFMIWLMLDNDYLVLTSSLAVRCAIGAATQAQCHQIGTTQTAPPPLQSLLLLPGINPYIPVAYGLIGIIIAVFIHEGTHGVIARRLNLPVKSTGVLFFLIVPIGAFVEIDEKLIQKAKFRDSGRIMAGGPGSNIVVALIALALMLLVVGGLVPAQFNGVQVQSIVQPTSTQASPAYTLYQQGHLKAGDLITAVNGTRVNSITNLSNYLANTRPNENLTLTIQQSGQTNNYTITLAKYPAANVTKGFIGISQEYSTSDLTGIKQTYTSQFFKDPLIYLIVPGIYPQANSYVPFSNDLAGLYSSPTLGAAWYPITLTLFWIWFINVNLAFFNAIPLYPLDGGQALMNFFSHFGRKWVEDRSKVLTTIVSLLMFALILSFLFLPRILGVIAFY
jgi:membrane-associated protease RseP (regulator of RpoE activity)